MIPLQLCQSTCYERYLIKYLPQHLFSEAIQIYRDYEHPPIKAFRRKALRIGLVKGLVIDYGMPTRNPLILAQVVVALQATMRSDGNGSRAVP